MYLTHIDAEGNDTPAILIENATAANRAVNLPEFVNLPPDRLREIGGPAIDYYRLVDRAMYFQRRKQYADAAAAWERAVAVRPRDPLALENLSVTQLLAGRRTAAAETANRAREAKLRQALADRPEEPELHNELGELLLDAGRSTEALAEFGTALQANPRFARAQCNRGRALAAEGQLDQALVELEKVKALDAGYAPGDYELGRVRAQRGETGQAIELWQQALAIQPKYAEAHAALAQVLARQRNFAEALGHWRAALDERPNDFAALRATAWLLATCPEPRLRNGAQAYALAVRAIALAGGAAQVKDPALFDTLAAAYAEKGQFEDAVLTARRAAELARASRQPDVAAAIERRAALYASRLPYRDGA
jgi:tetratricopeptide (TPR) repeat protein